MARRIAIASIIWGFSIFLSRIIGLIREGVIGRVLGGGSAADVYLTSFVIPDFLNSLLAGGALSIVFIPIFSSYLSRDNATDGWRALSSIGNFLFVAATLCCVALWYLTPALVKIVAPGFSPQQSEELAYLTRIILPAQLFHLVGGLLSAALQALDHHLIPALAPLVYTSCIIIGGLLWASTGDAQGFAWGVVVGSAIGPFALPLMACIRRGLRWNFNLRFWDHPDLKIYLLRSLPLMLGWSIVILDDWFLRRHGSLLGEGGVATVQYAKSIMRVPMGVFGLAAGVAVYPTISKLIGLGQRDEAYGTLAAVVRRMLILAFCAQAILSTTGPEIARLIYGNRLLPNQHNEIGWALALISIGLWGWAAHTVVARGFWALGRTWGPTILGTTIAIIAYPLYPLWAEKWGTRGLALASSSGISLYVMLLILWLRQAFASPPDLYLSFFSRIVPALALAIMAGLATRSVLPQLPPLLALIIISVAVTTTYLGLCIAFRVPDLREIGNLLLQRLGKRLRRFAAIADP